MSNLINTGGPAFPVTEAFDERRGEVTQYASEGISTRDYFAAKAMQALIGKEDKDFSNRGAKAVTRMAKRAYEYADAMLSEREVTQ